nr:hypothetical protein [Metallosphaera javensis (ex Hofmann et al. 2022)]
MHRVRIVISSSRDTSSRTRSFLNYLEYIFPFSVKVNRGKRNLEEVFRIARVLGGELLLLVNVFKGNPSSLEVYDVISGERLYHFLIQSLRLRSDYEKISLYNTRRILCIRETEYGCTKVNSLLIDLGATRTRECTVHAEVKFDNGCNVRFVDSMNREILFMGLAE